ncbi:hypothetical protein [Streptomyces montanisoli]|uniref:Uncharacterized protein n=1 Tax=Streptomyces montanisoli TaxID=2798581 RepID=A0A940RX63_9ACTN|nr:hypothetical protein [Streptomyces montanisoli]MBP0457299.1 hypothetical protein [Streptomyces montanisoli]
MRTNIARAAAVVALGMAALVPVTGTAFADGHDHGRHVHHDHGVGFIGAHGSYANLGGPYGITYAEGGFLAGGAH